MYAYVEMPEFVQKSIVLNNFPALSSYLVRLDRHIEDTCAPRVRVDRELRHVMEMRGVGF